MPGASARGRQSRDGLLVEQTGLAQLVVERLPTPHRQILADHDLAIALAAHDGRVLLVVLRLATREATGLGALTRGAARLGATSLGTTLRDPTTGASATQTATQLFAALHRGGARLVEAEVLLLQGTLGDAQRVAKLGDTLLQTIDALVVAGLSIRDTTTLTDVTARLFDAGCEATTTASARGSPGHDDSSRKMWASHGFYGKSRLLLKSNNSDATLDHVAGARVDPHLSRRGTGRTLVHSTFQVRYAQSRAGREQIAE